jgi:hypothetical protein
MTKKELEAELAEVTHKLECLLVYITEGLYSKSSYSKEDMKQMVDERIERELDAVLLTYDFQ